MSEEKPLTHGEYQAAGLYLIELIRCALQEEMPKKKPDTCTWEQIWQIAAGSKVEASAWPAVQKLMDTDIPAELAAKWKTRADAVLYRQLQFDMEREKILAELRNAGISYLPLKGINLQKYYPKPGMRYMCDNDILYGYVEADPSGGYRIKGENEEEQSISVNKAQSVLDTIMKKMGYTPGKFICNHDEYTREPFFNFEMHRDLLLQLHEKYFYYQNPWKSAVRSDENSFSYYFQDEDEYLYQIVHAFKHYNAAGSGLRTLVDEYVFLKKKSSLDWKYIQEEIRKLQLTEFEQQMRETAMHAFSADCKLTEEDCERICYMMNAGTYGTMKNRVLNKIEKIEKESESSPGKARARYIGSRIWKTEEEMKILYPYFYQHKSIRWFLPVWRLLKGIKAHPGRLIKELEIIFRSKNS